MEIIAGLLSRALLEGDWTRRTVWTQTNLTERRWNGDGTESDVYCESALIQSRKMLDKTMTIQLPAVLGVGVEPSCWKNSYLVSRFRFQNGEIIFPKYHFNLTLSIKKTSPVILAALRAHHAPMLMSCYSTSRSLIWDICRMLSVILST